MSLPPQPDDYRYRCTRCGECFDLADRRWRCSCGGLLGLDTPRLSELVAAPAEPWSLWRYRPALPFAAASEVWRTVTLGEGMTPLVPGPGLLFKLEFVMPTLSFKDRGAAVLVTKAAEIGVERLIADSSGNAGTSIAAYAGRAGIAAEIFVPAEASPKKVAAIGAFGARVRLVTGGRAATAAAAIEEVDATGAFYASHVYNPLFVQGTKTFAYELWEQLGRRVPGTVVLPLGNGTLVLGAFTGFADLVSAGLADRVPTIVAVQAARCAPLAAAFAGRPVPADAWRDTMAEGIAIADPPRAEEILAAVKVSAGTIITADEAGILPARQALARYGLDVEPTAAATYAAWTAWSGAPGLRSPVVLALCGAGLKSP